MKFSTLLALPLFAASALAQSIQIGAPAAGTSVSPGSSLVVEVDRPNSLTGSQEVAIVIALDSCSSSGGCRPPSDVLGNILYSGGFNPEYSTPADGKPPHQNFTVQIPSGAQSGTNLLTVTHFSLVGAGPYPLFEYRNITLNIAA
ncbi:hypothetical protein PLICRDRAFT_180650 [Plicaturopsis crispa FD-325 SS-3]|uniref:Uncharacterized protein n=1 Tax=Plicaturopsis crispa FD-325 SS-3 TaxID=944288 RepID=A0A0C9SVV1_PLICR|nr:hypothetical protein PLICRDRAFT_180650 [Plicaturopsis crispa FD-325 SS-3]